MVFNDTNYISDLKIHTLTQYQEIPISLEDAWNFFSKPENFETYYTVNYQSKTKLIKELEEKLSE